MIFLSRQTVKVFFSIKLRMFAWHLHFLAKAVYNSMADLSVWVQRHLSRVQEDFDEVDKDKSGSLDFPEVCNVLQKSGFKGTPEEAKVGPI